MTDHDIVAETRHVSCACGAQPDRPCTCGPAGVHLARIVHARRAGLIGSEDLKQAIHDADQYTGLSVLLDPEVVAQ